LIASLLEAETTIGAAMASENAAAAIGTGDEGIDGTTMSETMIGMGDAHLGVGKESEMEIMLESESLRFLLGVTKEVDGGDGRVWVADDGPSDL
jgi:hypothetical protein